MLDYKHMAGSVSLYQSKKYAFSRANDKVRFRKLFAYLDPRPAEKILDVGCNRGFYASKIQKISPYTYGIDINPVAIENGFARNLQVMDATSLDFPDESFDKVYSSHTIEHVPDPLRMLQEIERVLKPGGRLVLAYPAEPIRGLLAVPAAFVAYGNPFRARELHLHTFTHLRSVR